MSKSVERRDTDSRWYHLPKYESWVGSRAYNRGKTSRDKANKCLLNTDTAKASAETLRQKSGAKRIKGDSRTKHSGAMFNREKGAKFPR